MRLPQPIPYRRLYRGPLVLLLAVGVVPLLARGEYEYLLPLLQLCGIYAIIVTGLTLLMGFTGQVSLGHAGFYGLGAYAAGVAASTFHAPLWLAIPISFAVTGVLMLLIGGSILRLRGHYLALATLAIGVIITQAINSLEITGGAAGLYDLPELKPFGFLAPTALTRAYFIWAVVVVVIVWAIHLTESPAGRALRAVHGDEEAAESLGVSAFAVKLKVFVASGLLASVAGVLYAFVYSPSYLGPEEFSLMFSVTLLTMVVLGGMGSVWGGLAGAVVLTGLHEAITLLGEKLGATDTARYEQLVFGLILILIIIFSRDGLIPGLQRGARRLVRGARA